jgi:putative flippase GtrA
VIRDALDRLGARVPAALRQPLGFALVGCAGFASDALLFLLLTRGLDVPIYPARVLAFVPATVVTWLLNRHFVFRTSEGAHRRRDEYLRHITVQSLGIAVNFASFTFAVETGLGHGNAQLVPLAIGSLAAMVFNYLGSRRFVFRR